MINKEINLGIEDKESHVKNISNIVNSIRYNILTTKSEGKNRENADNMTFIMIEI